MCANVPTLCVRAGFRITKLSASTKLSCPEIGLHNFRKKMRKKLVKKAGKHFSVEDQHKIIQEMISSGCTKRSIWEKYTS
jgi:hypothetical protein